MKCIAFYNLKGGVGKTAGAVNCAYLAAANGYKTLLWDLDPQGSATFYMGLKAEKNETRQLLSNGMEINAAVQDSSFENLWVIPADLSARNADLILSNQKQSRKKLKGLLTSLKNFDIVILDCPPGISLLHENIFNSTDWILMPNIPTTLSIRSFETVMGYFKENDLDRGKIRCYFSMVDHRKSMHHDTLQHFYNNKYFFKNYIPYLSDVEKMGMQMLPVFEFANGSYAAECYRDLWKEVEKVCL
jgi:cellulose biosynthesis protein BcsQ